ncbi:MAG: DUF2059 domain-containing protein [Proteobacteria bacterium]|nr:DUF2059 domain-containing protein [Pseudomonadota bacterium]
MPKSRGALFALCLLLPALGLAAAGADAPPSDESIREVFEETHIQGIMGAALEQVKPNVRAQLQRELGGTHLNEKQRQIIEDSSQQRIALMQQALDWQLLEPKLIAAYREAFTQHDIDQMLVFYRSPTGQKAIAKQPQIMQQVGQFTMERVSAITPQLQQLQREMMQKVRAAADVATDPEAKPPSQ